MKLGNDSQVFLMHMGGLGDLVFLSGLVAGIKAALPRTRLHLLCRDEFASVTALYPVPPDEIIGINLNPYVWSGASAGLYSELDAVAEQLRPYKADLLIDGALRPTWFLWAAAVLLRAGTTACCGILDRPGALVAAVLDHLGSEPRAVESIEIPPGIHELQRYRRLAEHVASIPVPLPQLSIPAALAENADVWLRRHDLDRQAYIACFPAGNAATRVKRWPESNYIEVLGRLARERGLSALLIGETAERHELRRLSDRISAGNSLVYCSDPGEVGIAGALVAKARAHLGNDSGLQHLAQALGVPGVVIYGGGYWPRYAPWAAGTIGMVHPLPCFDCDWDCFLGHALCVESVPVDAVVAALTQILNGEIGDAAQIATFDTVDHSIRSLLSDIAPIYRAVQDDRAARLEVILEAERHRFRRNDRLSALQRAADERLDLINAISVEAGRRAAALEEVTAALAQRDARIAELEHRAEVERETMHAFQICTGLGAGNIGDELMARAFWEHLPASIALDVPLFPESVRQHAPYPAGHRYSLVDWNGNEGGAGRLPGLLVGGTPVTEGEGLHWPMQFLAPRLTHFHRLGLPVDAIGVGVDRLETAAARALFGEAFLPVRSWTVRSRMCSEALQSLGVAESRIRVGADWGWLHAPRADRTDWARNIWQELGIDPGRPLLVANMVNMQWRELHECRRSIAAALVAAAARWDLQIAFFCNECRDGEFFDAAAARDIGALMPVPTVLVPNAYYSPDEALALLRFATVTVGQRYHFVIESILAGTVPVAIPRGQKMVDLAGEIDIPTAGSVVSVDRDELIEAIGDVVRNRQSWLDRLERKRQSLAARAALNLSLLCKMPPYEACWPKAH
jgi:ADP-heptose:LPS heptosyltransferase/polysaccharide pyruvyl transferase WcaK-like protein